MKQVETTGTMFYLDSYGSMGAAEILSQFGGHGWELRFQDDKYKVYNAIGRVKYWAMYLDGALMLEGNNSPTSKFYRGCGGGVYLERIFKDEEEQAKVHELEEAQNSAKKDEDILYYEYLIRDIFGYPIPVLEEDLKEYCIQSIEANKGGLFRGKKIQEAKAKMKELENKIKGTKQYLESRYIILKEKDGVIYRYGYEFDLGRRPFNNFYHATPLVNISKKIKHRNSLPIIMGIGNAIDFEIPKEIDGKVLIWGDVEEEKAPEERKTVVPM